MEKLDYLVWRTGDDKPAQCAALIDAVMGVADTTAGLRIATADTDDAIPEPSLLMGRGPDLAAVVSVWLDSLDDDKRSVFVLFERNTTRAPITARRGARAPWRCEPGRLDWSRAAPSFSPPCAAGPASSPRRPSSTSSRSPSPT